MTQDMFSNLFSIYSLAIIPDPEVIELVRKLKNDLRQVLGRSYGSFNSPAHFTLFAFQAHDDDYPIIIEEFKRVLVGLKPLRIEVSGFSHFLRGSNSTFYIKPGASSAQQIQTYSKYVDAKFSIPKGKIYPQDDKHRQRLSAYVYCTRTNGGRNSKVLCFFR